MLEVHKIIRVPHVVSCGILFILFYVRSLQGGVRSKLRKMIIF